MKSFNFFITVILSSFLITSCFNQQKITIQELNQNESVTIKETPQLEDLTILQDKILNPKIKTVLCHKKEKELSLAIINLNSEEKLIVSFDDLDSDIKNYYYTIIHCNSDWTASNLMSSEYINGFTDEPITNYSFSFNTIQKFTHYEFEFPSVYLKPILSGNYVFKVYEEGGNTILYKRFNVLETKTTIEAQVRKATLVKDRNSKHEIDFTIKHPNLIISDPFSDIKVHLRQNNKEDNAITNLIPLFIIVNQFIIFYK